MMRTPLMLLLLAFTAIAGATLSDAHVTKLANGFKAALGKTLKEKLQSEGPVAAIDYCSEKAMPITAGYAEAHQIEIRRITTKFRNPDGKLLAGEQALLERMEADAEAGDLKPLYRLDEWAYQPLVIEAPCLICHGENLAPPVLEALNARYPKDQARGYALGQVRGAVAISEAK